MKTNLFWDIVKKEVARKDTNFEWLYQKTGISKGTFSSWKNRNIIPRADATYKIANALEVSVEYLLTGMDKINSPSNPNVNEIVKTIVCFDNNDLKAVLSLAQSLSARYLSKAR